MAVLYRRHRKSAHSLRDQRWQRLKLLRHQKDRWHCVGCGHPFKDLAAHHIRYASTPWGGGIHSIQSLCDSCHWKLGPHPYAGIRYLNREIVVDWCPMCGGDELVVCCDNTMTETLACMTCSYEVRAKMAPKQQFLFGPGNDNSVAAVLPRAA